MISTTPIALGDYVLASHWEDADPQDAWRVGFVCQLILTWNEPTRYVVGTKDGIKIDRRQYRYAKKITAEEGQEWLNEHSYYRRG